MKKQRCHKFSVYKKCSIFKEQKKELWLHLEYGIYLYAKSVQFSSFLTFLCQAKDSFRI